MHHVWALCCGDSNVLRLNAETTSVDGAVLIIRIRLIFSISIRPNTNVLFSLLFRPNRIFGTALLSTTSPGLILCL